MKPRSHRPLAKRLAFAATLLCLAFPALAGQTRTNAPATASPAATNALPVQPQILKSVFITPAAPPEGKDPFFPRSMRPYGPGPVVPRTNAPVAAVAVELHLNGISGTADRRFAIINSRTFATDEEGDVPTGRGRAHIRVVQIKADSAVVAVNGEQRVLRLRPGL